MRNVIRGDKVFYKLLVLTRAFGSPYVPRGRINSFYNNRFWIKRAHPASTHKNRYARNIRSVIYQHHKIIGFISSFLQQKLMSFMQGGKFSYHKACFHKNIIRYERRRKEKRAIPKATDTFNDSFLPRIEISAITSHFCNTASDNPRTSFPTTSAHDFFDLTL